MTYQEMFAYIQNGSLQNLLPPLQYITLPAHAKDFKIKDVILNLIYNNDNYQVLLVEADRIKHKNDITTIRIASKSFDIPDDTGAFWHARYIRVLAIHHGQVHYLLTAFGDTQEIADEQLKTQLIIDMIIEMDIHTKGRLKKLLAEADQIYISCNPQAKSFAQNFIKIH